MRFGDVPRGLPDLIRQLTFSPAPHQLPNISDLLTRGFPPPPSLIGLSLTYKRGRRLWRQAALHQTKYGRLVALAGPFGVIHQGFSASLDLPPASPSVREYLKRFRVTPTRPIITRPIIRPIITSATFNQRPRDCQTLHYAGFTSSPYI
ncbi:Hypothetical protein NTJ_06997 [Nesidiocoris tenuis]|uniref:Uncharacterized protein n=1 Tax=Nesidiocoris tenuis TaxID=355587 RepID=A0ABN7AQ33_9HEMI|nr:Hypothetical protein NTJ_06997 [Nesidiocoris tenuis]